MFNVFLLKWPHSHPCNSFVATSSCSPCSIAMFSFATPLFQPFFCVEFFLNVKKNLKLILCHIVLIFWGKSLDFGNVLGHISTLVLVQ